VELVLPSGVARFLWVALAEDDAEELQIAEQLRNPHELLERLDVAGVPLPCRRGRQSRYFQVPLADMTTAILAFNDNGWWYLSANRDLAQYLPAEYSLKTFAKNICNHFKAAPNIAIQWSDEAKEGLAMRSVVSNVNAHRARYNEYDVHKASAHGIAPLKLRNLSEAMAVFDLGLGVYGAEPEQANWHLRVSGEHFRRARALHGLLMRLEGVLLQHTRQLLQGAASRQQPSHDLSSLPAGPSVSTLASALHGLQQRSPAPLMSRPTTAAGAPFPAANQSALSAAQFTHVRPQGAYSVVQFYQGQVAPTSGADTSTVVPAAAGEVSQQGQGPSSDADMIEASPPLPSNFFNAGPSRSTGAPHMTQYSQSQVSEAGLFAACVALEAAASTKTGGAAQQSTATDAENDTALGDSASHQERRGAQSAAELALSRHGLCVDHLLGARTTAAPSEIDTPGDAAMPEAIASDASAVPQAESEIPAEQGEASQQSDGDEGGATLAHAEAEVAAPALRVSQPAVALVVAQPDVPATVTSAAHPPAAQLLGPRPQPAPTDADEHARMVALDDGAWINDSWLPRVIQWLVESMPKYFTKASAQVSIFGQRHCSDDRAQKLARFYRAIEVGRKACLWTSRRPDGSKQQLFTKLLPTENAEYELRTLPFLQMAGFNVDSFLRTAADVKASHSTVISLLEKSPSGGASSHTSPPPPVSQGGQGSIGAAAQAAAGKGTKRGGAARSATPFASVGASLPAPKQRKRSARSNTTEKEVPFVDGIKLTDLSNMCSPESLERASAITIRTFCITEASELRITPCTAISWQDTLLVSQVRTKCAGGDDVVDNYFIHAVVESEGDPSHHYVTSFRVLPKAGQTPWRLTGRAVHTHEHKQCSAREDLHECLEEYHELVFLRSRNAHEALRMRH